MSTITDSASTLMYNAQSLASSSNNQLYAIIASLDAMKDDFYRIDSSGFQYNIPGITTTDFPALIAEIQSYLDQVVVDATALDGLITNKSDQAISELTALLATLTPADVQISIPIITLDTADGIIAATNAVLDTQRRRLETEALERFASAGYPAPPGIALAAITDIRTENAGKKGAAAAEAIQQQQEKNAMLFLEATQSQFDLASQTYNAWAQFTNRTISAIGQIIADYEQSPFLNAQIQAETADALVTAYAGLNQAAMQLARTSGDVYKAELAPYRLDVLQDKLDVQAYQESLRLTSQGKLSVARALASALRDSGRVANAALGSITSHGTFVERSFS